MKWYDIKEELPRDHELCLLMCRDANNEVYYRVARYTPDEDYPWTEKTGVYYDGRTVEKWMDLFEHAVDMCKKKSPYRTFDNSKWQDRLCIEYFQLSDKIEKLEKALILDVATEDHTKLLFEQREYMLKYKDVLFRRICDCRISFYKDDEDEDMP